MKKHILKMLMIVAIALSFSSLADAQQFTVRIRPQHHVIARPPAPSPLHIWVSGEWAWDNGRYNYHEGYWDRPSNGRHRWVEGQWRHTRRGWYWVPGHWR
jgi:WXXGXW repeat (2 copies)